MSAEEEHTNKHQIYYTDDGGRPEVEQYDINSAFRPNDQVYILTPQREGPFTVREVSNGKCTLLDKHGALVDNGKWFNESDLELDD